MHKTPKPVDFKAKQTEFAAYIRDPDNNPPPADVKEQRIKMYRELFFNNIESFLSGNFPVLKNILGASQWLILAEDFFAKHACQTPHFSEIPEEFLDYLQNERDSSTDYSFMLELAHYEWVEMALSVSRNEVNTQISEFDNLLSQTLTLSPLAWPLAYQDPVHKIAPEFLPVEAPAQPTFLIVYRNPEDDVNFIEITAMNYRLLEIIQEQAYADTEACLKQVAKEMNHPNPEVVITGGLQILKDLAEKTIVLASSLI